MDAQAQILGLIVSTLAICGTLIGAARWLRGNYLAPMAQMVEEWRGEPGNESRGIPARLGALERITILETAVREIRAEVKPNGGGSMRDAVNRIEQTVGAGGQP